MTDFLSDSAGCPIFQDMSLDERQQVLELLERETYPTGETILREGRETQILWIIVHGRCEVVKMMKDGSEQQLAVLEQGAVFGEMSFFVPAPHSASVRTLTEVEVMRLSREKFDQLEQAGATAAYKIAFNTVRVLSDRVRRMDEWNYDLVERPEASQHREEWREFRAKLYADWQF